MKYFLIFIASLMMLVGCAPKQHTEDAEPMKVLVLYYSLTGTTKHVAEEMQKEMNADIEEITAIEPYDTAFQATIDRCQKEMTDSVLPEIKDIQSKIDDYDLVMLGYPIWFGEAARPMLSFISKYDLSKVKVVTFCTFGSGGTMTGAQSLQKYSKGQLNIEAMYGVRQARMKAMPKEVDYFLISNGLINGEYEKKDVYSDMASVTDKEKDIFDKACGNYPMLKAKPEKFATRSTHDGTDYLFEAVDTTTHFGKNIKVLISVNDENGGVPEFTEVVR